jgi:hypothetical protein
MSVYKLVIFIWMKSRRTFPNPILSVSGTLITAPVTKPLDDVWLLRKDNTIHGAAYHACTDEEQGNHNESYLQANLMVSRNYGSLD